MAIFVVEGVDFAGKTTLVNKLQKDLNLFSLKSPRPTSPGDIQDLVSKTNRLAEGMDIICDRIALISETIYGPIVRDHIEPLLGFQYAEFLLESVQPIVIWCCPPWDHVKSCNNDQMAGVLENLEKLYMAYQGWFNGQLMHKLIVIPYDFTKDSYETLKYEVEGYLDFQKGEVIQDREMTGVCDFHNKFGVEMPFFVQLINDETFEFRKKFLQEELDEFVKAHQEGDIVTAFDSLLDLCYVAKGSALLMGIDAIQWAKGFDIVQNANMQKRRALSASESKRGFAGDVIKPENWQPPEPELKQILGL